MVQVEFRRRAKRNIKTYAGYLSKAKTFIEEGDAKLI